MKTVKILGTGCSNCNQMENMVQSVINQLKLNIKIEKVDDIQEIMKYNIMSTPALVIDEKVVVKGRVPSLAETKEILENVNASSCCSGSGDSCCVEGHQSEEECCSSASKKAEKTTCCEPNSGCC